MAGAVLDLGDMVVDWQRDGGNVDVIAGAARGALDLMANLGHRLNKAKGDIQALGISTRDEEGNPVEPQITQMPNKAFIRGRDVLWPDDVKDTGLTEQIARGVIMDDIEANSFTSVALGYKPESDETNTPPTRSVFETDLWIVFSDEREPEYYAARERLIVEGASLEQLNQLKLNFMIAQGINPEAAALPDKI